MNIENLTQEEVVQLQRLLGKLNPTKQVEVKVDPLTIMVDDIIDEFNFEKVQKTMHALDWTWASIQMTVPSISELKNTARYLLINAYNMRQGEYKDTHPEVPVTCGTGGFTATALANEEGTVDWLKLQFVVTEWESEL
jgi:hypothetical protein